LVLYRVVPNRRVRVAEVWPGALAATVMWTLLRIGFTWYATGVANYDSAFGPISAAISLLVFLYFASVVVLLGAEVARASVLDDEEHVAAMAAAAAPGVVAEARAASDGETTPAAQSRPIPGWAMAVGGAAAGLLVRLLSGRGRRGRRR
ncbi:MAG TPA: YhjD/YihY/BrkB family envelope integrity protein, partial [Candidatus Limnocylindria bacterium]